MPVIPSDPRLTFAPASPTRSGQPVRFQRQTSWPVLLWRGGTCGWGRRRFSCPGCAGDGRRVRASRAPWLPAFLPASAQTLPSAWRWPWLSLLPAASSLPSAAPAWTERPPVERLLSACLLRELPVPWLLAPSSAPSSASSLPSRPPSFSLLCCLLSAAPLASVPVRTVAAAGCSGTSLTRSLLLPVRPSWLCSLPSAPPSLLPFHSSTSCLAPAPSTPSHAHVPHPHAHVPHWTPTTPRPPTRHRPPTRPRPPTRALMIDVIHPHHPHC